VKANALRLVAPREQNGKAPGAAVDVVRQLDATLSSTWHGAAAFPIDAVALG